MVPDYNKPILYDGKQKLTGLWEITLKIDGCRAFIDTTSYKVTSRGDKPFLHFTKDFIDSLSKEFPELEVIDCEVFRNSWEETITLLKNDSVDDEVIRSDVYVLPESDLDRRLHVDWIENPSDDKINKLMEDARKDGHEGIVLRQDNKWFKVKPVETYDVKVIDILEGKKQPDVCEFCNLDRLVPGPACKGCGRLFRDMKKVPSNSVGCLVTEMGNVGSGLSHYLKQEIWNNRELIIGESIIEVKAMELTKGGKFRHPVFLRFRRDK